MKRRLLLSLIPPAMMGSLAGCMDQQQARSIGESVTYEGVEMSVTDSAITNDYAEIYRDGDEVESETAEPGAIFLLIKISIEHVGETEIFLPTDFELIYKQEDASFLPTGFDIRANGTTYPSFTRELENKDADSGAFPGTTVQGWVVFALPEGFDRSDAFVTIEHDTLSIEAREFRWRLAE